MPDILIVSAGAGTTSSGGYKITHYGLWAWGRTNQFGGLQDSGGYKIRGATRLHTTDSEPRYGRTGSGKVKKDSST